MDKRYQVFVSSTFTDLKDERQAVLRAILELDHMPAGMELFPAADATAWQIIKDVIDASDYYVLVVGGRYGSLDDTGISFTEKEYDHAIASGKAVIPLLHGDPDNIPRGKTETDGAAWESLKRFRAKVEKRHTCVYWTTPDDLKARVILGLTSAMKRSPAIGWVRADKVPTDATVSEILTLWHRVADLEEQLRRDRLGPPPGAEDLVQGAETFSFTVAFQARERIPTFPHYKDVGFTLVIEPTWDDIFAAIAPNMISEASHPVVRDAFRQYAEDVARRRLKANKDLKGKQLHQFEVEDRDVDTAIVQYRALGLMHESQRPRSVKDTRTYWSLTPYGDEHMTRLRALRRNSAQAGGPEEEEDGEDEEQDDEEDDGMDEKEGED